MIEDIQAIIGTANENASEGDEYSSEVTEVDWLILLTAVGWLFSLKIVEYSLLKKNRNRPSPWLKLFEECFLILIKQRYKKFYDLNYGGLNCWPREEFIHIIAILTEYRNIWSTHFWTIIIRIILDLNEHDSWN